MVNVKDDLTGKTFGLWTVICQAEDYISLSGNHYAQWLCECGCDKKTRKIVSQRNLKSGRSLSCGCIKAQKAKDRLKKINKYDLSGEYGIGYASNGGEFYFDLEDYNKIKNYCWRMSKAGYIVTSMFNNNKRSTIYMHVLIMNKDNNDCDVDHICSDKKHDNRKENLRLVSHSQNMMNRKIQKNNTSGVTGIMYFKRTGKWRAAIKINKKNKNLGYFNNFDDAVKTRKQAEEKYFGEFSYDNSQAIGGS